MSQHELDRAVARATGESLRTIREFGFTLVKPESRPARRRPPGHQWTRPHRRVRKATSRA
jgi:hypothetical protein